MGHAMLSQIILNNFPQSNISLAIGYGSKVVKQKGNSSGGDLVDLIFVVDDPLEWHKDNLFRNSQHYSAIKYLPKNNERVTQLQENFGAQIYYNPYVQIANVAMKYGIIKTEHLLDDLRNWTHLYVAGRLQKPVEFLINTCDKNDRLKQALRLNKESAIRAALLQLPETFDPEQLYTTIVGMSYHGDVRMTFFEDKNKISRIVRGQMDRFDQIYLPILRMSPFFKDSIQWNETKKTFVQDVNPKTTFQHLRLLPSNVRRKSCSMYSREARTMEYDAVLISLSRNMDCGRIIAQAIASIVRRSSFSQSFKGIFSAGLVKSLRYSQRKMFKSLNSVFS